MRLVMTLKVRDEEDVIEDNLRFHRAMGVDFFVVMDNGSVDGTPEILARYADAGLAHVLRDETGDLRGLGAKWYTRMGRMAATEFEADWVIHNDADEFWWPISGTLKEALAEIPESFGAVVAPRAEFVGRPDGPGSFAERLVFRERRSTLQPKVAHRADPDVVVLHRGAHDIAAAANGEPVARAAPARAGGASRRARRRGRAGKARRTFGLSGRRPGRFASCISRFARSSSSAAAPRSHFTKADFATAVAFAVCAGTTSRDGWRSCTPS